MSRAKKKERKHISNWPKRNYKVKNNDHNTRCGFLTFILDLYSSSVIYLQKKERKTDPSNSLVFPVSKLRHAAATFHVQTKLGSERMTVAAIPKVFRAVPLRKYQTETCWVFIERDSFSLRLP